MTTEPEYCPRYKCNSKNIALLQEAVNDEQFDQWECHDCGEIFYHENKRK